MGLEVGQDFEIGFKGKETSLQVEMQSHPSLVGSDSLGKHDVGQCEEGRFGVAIQTVNEDRPSRGIWHIGLDHVEIGMIHGGCMCDMVDPFAKGDDGFGVVSTCGRRARREFQGYRPRQAVRVPSIAERVARHAAVQERLGVSQSGSGSDLSCVLCLDGNIESSR
jgi:hypothetical protein